MRNNMTVKEAAIRLCVDRRTVHYWLKAHPEIVRPRGSGLTFEQFVILAAAHTRPRPPDLESWRSAITEQVDGLEQRVAALIRALQRSDLAYTGPQVAVR